MVTGLTYNFLPFMVLPLYASLEKIDLRLIEAGKDLYANGFTSFRKITLPLSMPGLVAGTLLTFIPAAGDYINAELLGTPQQYMIGNVIDSLFLVQLDYPAAAACSVVLMLAIVVMVLVYVRRAGTEELCDTPRKCSLRSASAGTPVTAGAGWRPRGDGRSRWSCCSTCSCRSSSSC